MLLATDEAGYVIPYNRENKAFKNLEDDRKKRNAAIILHEVSFTFHENGYNIRESSSQEKCRAATICWITWTPLISFCRLESAQRPIIAFLPHWPYWSISLIPSQFVSTVHLKKLIFDQFPLITMVWFYPWFKFSVLYFGLNSSL